MNVILKGSTGPIKPVVYHVPGSPLSRRSLVQNVDQASEDLVVSSRDEQL